MLKALIAGLIVALLAVAPAEAREAINNFQETVALSTDGSVDVVETLDVQAEGDQIRHGIFRDIPTILVNDDGSKLHARLDVIEVTRDGDPEPYKLERIGNGFVRIRIGSADTLIAAGQHRYVIHYTMTRMGRIFPDHDELFWNVTGNYWDFPILAATARVTLPEGANISRLTAYTGRPGSKEQAATVDRLSPDTALFTTTRALRPGEGLTIALAFQTGVLVPPGPIASAQYWLSDHRDLVVPAIGVLLVLFYNILAWDSVGRDPRKGTIIPRFHPPQGMSPALVHYVHNFGWKKSGWTALTAAIFDLGVKGLVTVDNKDDTLVVTARDDAKSPELADEEAILAAYFKYNGVTRIDKTNGPDLDKKRRQVLDAVRGRAGERYFRRNYLYSGVGLALALAVLGAMVWLDVLDLVWLIGGAIVAAALFILGSAFGNSFGARGLPRFFLLIWLVVIGGNALAALGSSVTSVHFGFPVLAGASIVLVTAIFGWLMRAATVEGRRIMDEIDGFRMYMETAEKNRLNFVDEPQMSVARFEAILPFAIALGVEKPWSERFEADLARNAVADAPGGVYHPLWYTGTGRGFDSRNFSSAVTAAATGMSAAMIAAQPARSSSSGFGGGGGSGGGGGGGGGGGW